jgi:hypothetical protein
MIPAAVLPVIAQCNLFWTDPEKLERCFCVRIVIDRECADIPDLLVEPFLRCPDIPDAFKQFIGVIRTDAAPFPEPLVIEHETFDEIIRSTVRLLTYGTACPCGSGHGIR